MSEYDIFRGIVERHFYSSYFGYSVLAERLAEAATILGKLLPSGADRMLTVQAYDNTLAIVNRDRELRELPPVSSLGVIIRPTV